MVKHLADQHENSWLGGRPGDPFRDGVGVTPVNLAQTVEILEKWRAEERRAIRLFHLGSRLGGGRVRSGYSEVLNQSGLTTEDGMPLVGGASARVIRTQARVCGSDLLLAICERHRSVATGNFYEEALALSRVRFRASSNASQA